jgi:hypothetical protein
LEYGDPVFKLSDGLSEFVAFSAEFGDFGRETMSDPLGDGLCVLFRQFDGGLHVG